MSRPPADHQPPARRESAPRLLLRFALAVAALALLWAAAREWRDLLDEFTRTFELRLLQQFQVVLLCLLAGVALGLAVVLPQPPWRYGAGRAVAAAVAPLAFVAVVLLVINRAALRVLPRWVLSFLQPFGGEVLVFAALLLGMALAAGFSASGPRATPTEGA